MPSSPPTPASAYAQNICKRSGEYTGGAFEARLVDAFLAGVEHTLSSPPVSLLVEALRRVDLAAAPMHIATNVHEILAAFEAAKGGGS